MSESAKFWIMGLVCLVLVHTGASLLSPHSFGLVALSDLIQLVLLISAAISCAPSIFRNRGRARLFWLLMGLGLASWASYQLLWTYLEIQGREVPSLWGPDAVLFLHIVPMMAALALQPNVEQHDRDLRLGSLDFALLLLWWVCWRSTWLPSRPGPPGHYHAACGRRGSECWRCSRCRCLHGFLFSTIRFHSASENFVWS